MDLGLERKRAIVTGGSRGMGLSIARKLASEGCDVAICGRHPEPLEAAAAELRSSGSRIFTQVADITADNEVEAFVSAAAEDLGGIDCLVCSAGGGGVRRFGDSTPADWRSAIELNLIHAVRAIQAAVPFFAQREGGAVVLISSISGSKHERISPNYSVSKAAETYLAGSLLWELGPLNIRINAVSPGSILHDNSGWARLQRENPQAYADYEELQFPLGRLGTADEVANVVAFLLSPQASWINGANIPVDGGQAGGFRR